MSFLSANCPSCAAPIEFKSGSSIVIVCPFCRSAVARTDRALEDLGKVAEIMQSQSPLRVGLHGLWNNQRFELTGRAQIRHQLGGVWDEWYATFGNGWVGWLAEAQGKFYLTFYQPLPQGAQLPSFQDLQLGQNLPQIPAKNPLMVAEKGVATAVAAEGEIPYKLVPNEESAYADLAGKDRVFATIDYGMNPPFVFVGQELTLAELGWADMKPAERKAPRVAAAGIGCPNCGGPLSLQAPDAAERVTCPNCDSLLDINQGKLTWLKALKPKPDAEQFALPIGAKGTFADGKEMTILGAVVRSVLVEGIKYYWHEYLLYNPAIGFRWLLQSDNHWSFVEPVNVADVVGMGNSANYNGKDFKLFQDAPATVEYVKGEFYWRVEQGETVRAIDYVRPPLMLSNEMSGNEMNFSLGTYITTKEVEKAFNLQESLPKPWNVAPNQPFGGSFYYTWGFALVGLLFLVALLMIPLGGFSSTPLNQSLTLPPLPSANGSNPVFSQPFELKGNRNIQITMTAPLKNSWASFDVDLVNEANNQIETVPIDVEFYSGVDGGESWSEGSTTQDVSLSSAPAGRYMLRIDGQWQNWQQPLPVTVRVEQNVTRGMNFCCAFVLLLIIPLISLVRKWLFESSRWSQSMFSTSGESDDGDDD
jgi:Zn finger protein HypA/HybF involved in hydrogenase expression